MPKKDPTYERIERALYKDRDDSTQLTQRELEIKKRMMLCVSKKMESPLIEDTEIVTFLMNGCGGQADPVCSIAWSATSDSRLNHGTAT